MVLDKKHPLSDLYYRKARYKVYWGGRGAAKSWAFAEALVRMAAATPIQVLCLREYQNSIGQSVHRLLKKTIYRLGLEGWFTVTKSEITSRTGAQFFFKGLQDPDSLRSFEDVDICWVTEAATISAYAWEVLLPTLRNKNCEVWIDFNMKEESDATYQTFVATPRPNSIIHKVNYDLNPWFGDTPLYAEMLHDKQQDYELYEHIWLGFPRKRSNAIVLNGKYRVEDFADDLWEKADRLYLGADFGYAEDPSTLIRNFDLVGEDGKRRLYIEYEAYGYHIETNSYAEFYDEVPGARDWQIKGDCSLPATISAIRTQGFAIDGAEKWPGSVEDGIKYLRGYDEIIIHPRCVKTADEAYKWRWKTDPKQLDHNRQPVVLPVLKSGNDHCWDAVRYSRDGHIQRSGDLGQWGRLAQ